MKLAGDYLFEAPQTVAWDALLDPKVLASVLPGCERLELIGVNEYEGQLQMKVGPVQGDFLGKVKLENLSPPTSYEMTVDGRGAPGFVKAVAKISLAAEGDATRFTYDSDAQIGGRIASVGQRLIESSARAIIKTSLDGLNDAMKTRAAAVREVARAGGSESQAAAAAAAVPLAPPTSQTAFAAEVAREVAKDLLPPGTRWVIVAIVLVILAVLVVRIMF
jgi:hypothetical protein